MGRGVAVHRKTWPVHSVLCTRNYFTDIIRPKIGAYSRAYVPSMLTFGSDTLRIAIVGLLISTAMSIT